MTYYGIEYHRPDGGMHYTGGSFTNILENKKRQFLEVEEIIRSVGENAKDVVIKLVSLENDEYANEAKVMEEIRF